MIKEFKTKQDFIEYANLKGYGVEEAPAIRTESFYFDDIIHAINYDGEEVGSYICDVNMEGVEMWGGIADSHQEWMEYTTGIRA
jgi:hypothetical protein